MSLTIKMYSAGVSGGGSSSSSNSFTTIQPITGTSPVASSATDTLTFTSSDGSVGIAGDSSTDTLDFTVAATLAFKTIACPTGSNPVADTATDTLTLATGNALLTIAGDSTADSVTFTVVPGGDALYALLAGRSGGQSLTGGTGSGESLTLVSTSHATKGAVIVTGRFSAGSSNTNTGTASNALGNGNTTSNFYSFAVGSDNISSNISSVAMGTGNAARGAYSMAIGNLVDTYGDWTNGIGRRLYGTPGVNGHMLLGDSAPDGAGVEMQPIGADTFNARFKNGYGFFSTTTTGPAYRFLQATVNTTDTTVTTLHSFTTATDKTYKVTANVCARRTGGSAGAAGDSAVYQIECMVKNIAGTLSVSTIVKLLETEDQVLMDATVDVSGTALRVRVTGTTNNNFTWTSRLELDIV